VSVVSRAAAIKSIFRDFEPGLLLVFGNGSSSRKTSSKYPPRRGEDKEIDEFRRGSGEKMLVERARGASSIRLKLEI
jgi:hypothetical protein